MNKSLNLTWHKLISLFYSALCISFLLFVSACDNDNYSSPETGETGSISFSIEWRGAPTIQNIKVIHRAIDCVTAEVATVTFEIYDQNDIYLAGDSWNCEEHFGIVNNVPPGLNRKLVVSGKNNNGDVIYQGEETGIPVNAGENYDVGIIVVDLIAPTWTMLNLPDTGQTTSYTATWGEDSDYTINPPSYTDNGDGTVTDNVTSLMWQQLNDNTERTWDDANSYCDNLTLAGYYDWWLPSAYELMSIVNCDTYAPSIDTTFFPGTNTARYWSSTTSASNSYYAWLVIFYEGNVVNRNKTNYNYVQCVRAGQ